MTDLVQFVITSTAALVYISLLNLLPYSTFFKFHTPLNLLFLSILYYFNRDLSFSAIGFHSQNIVSSILFGIGSGILISIPIVLLVLLKGADMSIQDPRFVYLSSRKMLLYGMFVHILFATAVFEEIIHRGIILSRLQEVTNTFYAIIFSSLIFAAWHIVSTVKLFWPTITANIQSIPLQYSAYFGFLLITFFAGIVFSIIRIYTGNIAGAIVAHWIINSSTLLAFYFFR